MPIVIAATMQNNIVPIRRSLSILSRIPTFSGMAPYDKLHIIQRDENHFHGFQKLTDKLQESVTPRTFVLAFKHKEIAIRHRDVIIDYKIVTGRFPDHELSKTGKMTVNSFRAISGPDYDEDITVNELSFVDLKHLCIKQFLGIAVITTKNWTDPRCVDMRYDCDLVEMDLGAREALGHLEMKLGLNS